MAGIREVIFPFIELEVEPFLSFYSGDPLKGILDFCEKHLDLESSKCF